MRKNGFRPFLFSLTLGLVAGFLASVWIWSDYRKTLHSHEQVLIVRGEGILSALGAGIRSHRNMGMWFRSNIDSVLQETSTAPGIEGLAVFAEDGSRLAQGGTLPEGLTPSVEARWSGSLLAISRKTRIGGEAGGMQGMRRGGMTRSGSAMDADNRMSEGSPVWLTVVLDGSDTALAMAKDHWRFLYSVAIAAVAIVLGSFALFLFRRQSGLAELLRQSLAEQKRFEEQARLAAGLAHETKNPLSLIRGMAQTCLNRADAPEPIRTSARRIVDESDRLQGRIDAFLTYSRPRHPEWQRVDLEALLRETVALFEDEANEKGVRLTASAESVFAFVDPDLFRQMGVNLLANAMAACQKGDSIEAAIARTGRQELEISIRDTGSGIDPEDLPRVREPYFTRRPGGTGLGLAIVDQLVQAHGWRLNLESRKGEGTRVSISGIREESRN
jgi:two-component system sensor histidine kinase HydH